MLERDGGFLYLFDEVGETSGVISDSLNHYFELFCETINHLVTDGVITLSNMDRYNTSNRQPVMFAFSSPHGPCSIHLSCHHDKPFLQSCLDHRSVRRICMVCQGLFLRPIPEHLRPSAPQDCEVRRLFVVEGGNRIQNQQRHCASCRIEVIKTGHHKCGGCGLVSYCDTRCAKAHWRLHKHFCRWIMSDIA